MTTHMRHTSSIHYYTVALFIAILLVMTTLLTADLYADVGDLDPTFGSDGKVTTTIGSAGSYGQAVAVQSDGKIVMGGYSASGPGSSTPILVRFTPDGALDTDFGEDGIVQPDVFYGSIQAIALQADGKIVVGGTVVDLDFNAKLFLARFDSSGALDTTFGNDGFVRTDVGSGFYEIIYALLIQNDGKIVAGGTTVSSDEDLVIVRYHVDGTLDTSFGGDGVVTSDLGGEEELRGLAIDSDGKIIGVGNSDSQFAVVRYSSNGVPDATFGASGVVTTAVGSGSAASAVVVQQDGRIAVGGQGAGDLVVARYEDDGDLDTTFGTAGVVTTDLGGSEIGGALLLQADNKLLLIGTTNEGGDSDVAAVRFNSDGALDNSFGTAGVAIVHRPDMQTATHGVLQSDGKIALGGSDYKGLRSDISAARLTSTGTPDSSFGGDAFTSLEFPGSSRIHALHVLANGKIIAAGYADNGAFPDFAVAQYHANGSLDTAFGDDGVVVTDFGVEDIANAMAVQADGKIILAGQSGWSVPGNDVALARYNTDGSLDTTFGNGGMVLTDLSASAAAVGVVVQASGKIVVAAYREGDLILIRYEASGAVDSGFGTDGVVSTRYGDYDFARSLLQQADGSLVLVGESYNISGHTDVILARFDSEGNIDTGFGENGVVITDFGQIYDYGHDIVQQPDGKLVVIGSSNNGNAPYYLAMARYNSDGSLDVSFGNSGFLLDDLNFQANGLTTLDDGSLVAVGSSSAGTPPEFALARFDSQGNLDTTIGTDGIVITTFDDANNSAQTVMVQEDGKILAAGSGSQDFALVRYLGDAVLADLESVTISGPLTGNVETSYEFTATVAPVDVSGPITYTWVATGHEPITRTAAISDTISFSWTTAGVKTVSVTADGGVNQVDDQYTVTISATIEEQKVYLPMFTH